MADDARPKPEQVVLHIQWQEDSEPRQEIYGPWTLDEDDAHLGRITQFLKDWPRVTGVAEADSVTMVIVQDPDAWLRARQEGRG